MSDAIALNLFKEIIYICDHSMDGRKVPCPRNASLMVSQRSCLNHEISCLKEQRIFIKEDLTYRNLTVALGLHTGRFNGERFVVFTEDELRVRLPRCYEYSSERFLLIIAHILRVNLQTEGLCEEYRHWGSAEDEHFGDLSSLWPECKVEYEKVLAGDNINLNDMQLLFFIRFGIQVKLPHSLLGALRQALCCRIEQQPYVSTSIYRTTIWSLVLNIEHEPIVDWLRSHGACGIDRDPVIGTLLQPLSRIMLVPEPLDTVNEYDREHELTSRGEVMVLEVAHELAFAWHAREQRRVDKRARRRGEKHRRRRLPVGFEV